MLQMSIFKKKQTQIFKFRHVSYFLLSTCDQEHLFRISSAWQTIITHIIEGTRLSSSHP